MSRFVSPYSDALSLRELLPEAERIGGRDAGVRSCTCDSRVCQPGDVFVAIAGTHADGHAFADEAAARGAAAIVAERPIDLDKDVPVYVVPDSRSALGQICQALARRPSEALRVIGVTGTNGKTTTTQLIASILAAAGHRTGTLGTLGYSDGIDTEPAELTTPTAPVLAQWLARMVDGGCSHAVMEISSHAIAERRTAGIELSAACLTNLRRDHLDYHGTLVEYHRTKSKIFQSLGPRSLAVINADDPASLEYAPLVPRGVLTVGIEKPANVTASSSNDARASRRFCSRPAT